MNQQTAPPYVDVVRRAADIASQALEGTKLGNAAVGHWVHISGPVAEVLGTKIGAALNAEDMLVREPRAEDVSREFMDDRRCAGQIERADSRALAAEQDQARLRAQLGAVDRFLSLHSHVTGGEAGEAGPYLDALRELRAVDAQDEPAVGASVRTAAGCDWFRTKRGWVESAMPCGRPRTWSYVLGAGPVRRLWVDFAEIPVGTTVADRDEQPMIRTAMRWREALAISENRGPFTARAPIGARDE